MFHGPTRRSRSTVLTDVVEPQPCSSLGPPLSGLSPTLSLMTRQNPVRLSPMWRARIDALLPFLDPLTAPGFEPMVPHAETAGLTIYGLSPVMSAFVQALYEHQWVDEDFNWPSWQVEAETWFDPTRVATADVQTIRQLLTTHARKERFCEGHLADVLRSGHLPALLRRLGELRRGGRWDVARS